MFVCGLPIGTGCEIVVLRGRVDGCYGCRLALIVRPIDARSDEEEYFATRIGCQFSLEEISQYGNRSKTRRALLSLTFVVSQNTTHNRGAAVWNQNFRLHALSVDARNATNGNAGIDRVVFNRDAKDNRARICNLWRDGKT